MYRNGNLKIYNYDSLRRQIDKLKDKERVMLDVIDGEVLAPEYTDDYMDEYSIEKILPPT